MKLNNYNSNKSYWNVTSFSKYTVLSLLLVMM